jgi:hypothetical protein
MGRPRPTEQKGAGKEFFGLGVSINPWKGSFRPRKSKEIQAVFFDFLCSGFAGLGWIWVDLGLVWNSRYNTEEI